MNKRILNNGDLDKLGDRLLRAGKLRPDEIEEIVSAPFLFSAVKRQISQGPGGGLSRWGRLTLRQIGIFTSAAAALLLIIGGLFIFNSRPLRSSVDIPTVKQQATTDSQPIPAPEPAPFDGAPAPLHDGTPAPLPARFKFASNDRPSITHSIYAGYHIKNKPSDTAGFRNRWRGSPLDNPAEFRPLYAALSDQEDGNGQIIRVDLPPSILHAIGVQVQVENEIDKIKTDLLLGPDGGLRAFRLVGKY